MKLLKTNLRGSSRKIFFFFLITSIFLILRAVIFNHMMIIVRRLTEFYMCKVQDLLNKIQNLMMILTMVCCRALETMMVFLIIFLIVFNIFLASPEPVHYLLTFLLFVFLQLILFQPLNLINLVTILPPEIEVDVLFI